MSDDDLQAHFRRKDRLNRRSAQDAARSRELFDAVRDGDDARARRVLGMNPAPDGADSSGSGPVHGDLGGIGDSPAEALKARLLSARERLAAVNQDAGLTPDDRRFFANMWQSVEISTMIDILRSRPDADDPDTRERIGQLEEHHAWLTRTSAAMVEESMERARKLLRNL